MFILTVTEPFADFQRGDQIKDQALIAKILDSENAGHVVKVQAPADPDSKPK